MSTTGPESEHDDEEELDDDYDIFYFTARCKPSFAHRKAIFASCCICYDISVRLSVCHTPVLCQNKGTQKDAVIVVAKPSVSSFLMPTIVDGGQPVQVKF